MKLYVEDKEYKLFNGDMLDMLEVIAPNSIDAIVCDPPYGLTSITKRFGKEDSAPCKESKGFMGKTWDGTGIEYNVDAWRKCYEVLKPGGYLLAFGGTRTYHRIACAIEDAGFEIRDCLMYLYGSGFPKSMNIGKAIDSKLKYNKSNSKALKQLEQSEGTNPHIIKQLNNGIMGEIKDTLRKDYQSQNKWAGYGTAFKPAYEPIIMARKPIESTVADNVLKYGVGGINIDECRIKFENTPNPATNPLYRKIANYKLPEKGQKSNGSINFTSSKNETNNNGRFPANVITDGSNETIKNMNLDIDNNASRYFYCAKASKKDRDEGLDMFDEIKVNDGRKKEIDNGFQRGLTPRRNIHPTVKPIELMQYLIRLVLPKGGTLLDCFMGSGSTGKACMFENRERNANYYFIGIELTEEYLPIAHARIDYAINKYKYDEKKIEEETGQLNLFDFDFKDD